MGEQLLIVMRGQFVYVGTSAGGDPQLSVITLKNPMLMLEMIDQQAQRIQRMLRKPFITLNLPPQMEIVYDAYVTLDMDDPKVIELYKAYSDQLKSFMADRAGIASPYDPVPMNPIDSQRRGPMLVKP